MKKYFFVLLFAFALMLGVGDSVYASEAPLGIVSIIDDPQAERAKGKILDGFYDEVATDDEYGISLLSLPYGYTHNSKFADYTVLNGIDVSYYQTDIDWNAVKADGIDFAIIRVGYRGYGTSGNLREDTRYVQNIQGALNAGLKVGVYIFSQATTTAEAVEEADFVLSRIRGYDIEFPVVMDFEYASLSSGEGGRLYDANLSRREATEVCKAFCQRVASAGYRPMVYANKSMLKNAVYASELSANYDIWLANYTYTTDYEGDYTCWQYTSNGSVNGISGRVDMNFWYEKPSTVYKGVDYSAVYNFDYYMDTYSDLASAYRNDSAGAIAHFVEYGMAEGRQGNAEFNVYAYKNRYVDLRNAFGTDLKRYYMHYVNGGKSEGRIATGSPALTGRVTVYDGKDYSDVFNYDYYITKYPDLQSVYAGDDIGALRHYVNAGMAEGRQGNAEFNVYTYRNRYADLRRAYGSDLKKYYMHYVNAGKDEGRSGAGTEALVATTVYNGVDYSAVYNYDYYISTYSDIKNAFGDDDFATLQHFVNGGMAEGRQGNSEFNVYTYKNNYVDLRRAFGNDLKRYYMHYINSGKAEGRVGNEVAQFVGETIYNGVDYAAVYNYDYYVAKYPDLKNAYNGDENALLQHFVEHGMAEGRQGSADFNVRAYMYRNEDLRNAFGNDLKSYYMHYVSSGKEEGRNGAPYNAADYAAVYDYNTYVTMNPGLASAYGNDAEQLLAHFIEHGMAEGRQASAEFNVYAYRSLNPDLQVAFGDDLARYYMHYIYSGKAEGRVATWEAAAAATQLLSLDEEEELLSAEEKEPTEESVESEISLEFDTSLDTEADSTETVVESETESTETPVEPEIESTETSIGPETESAENTIEAETEENIEQESVELEMESTEITPVEFETESVEEAE